MERLPFFVTCETRTEGVLRDELLALGVRGPRGANGGVEFLGPFREGLLACLHARTAMRVLLRIGEGPAGNADALYKTVYDLDWSAHLSLKTRFAVRASVRDSKTLTHSQFVALKVKDAIVDRMRDRAGGRPDVSRDDPDVPVHVRVAGDTVRIFLDLAGEPLHRRGYRAVMTEAPLKETLAASILALAKVENELPFLDPMCGSGTFPIEQALRARNIPPGWQRRFAFERWPSHDWQAEWNQIRQAAREQILARVPAPIFASDGDATAIAAARKNAAAIGVAEDIGFSVADCTRLKTPAEQGTIRFNPPYGQRLPELRGSEATVRRGTPSTPPDAVRGLARALGFFWGWTVVVLSPDSHFADALGVTPDFTHRLSNGGLDVHLQRYTLKSDGAKNASQATQPAKV